MSEDQKKEVKKRKMVKCPICRESDIEEGEECCDNPRCICIKSLTVKNQVKAL